VPYKGLKLLQVDMEEIAVCESSWKITADVQQFPIGAVVVAFGLAFEPTWLAFDVVQLLFPR